MRRVALGSPSGPSGSPSWQAWVTNALLEIAKASVIPTSLDNASSVTGDLDLSNIEPGAALSVLGVAGNAAADYAGIVAAADKQVLRREGAAIGFGAVDLAAAAAVTGDLPFANMPQLAAMSVLGVGGGSTADMAPITAATDHQVLRRSGSTVAFGALNLASADATTGALPINRGGTASATAADARTALGLAIGVDVQGYDVELAAFAGLTSAADKLPYFTGAGTAGVADFTAAGRALLDDAAATNQLTTLGLSANGKSLVTAADYAAMKVLLDLEIGTDVQAYDADLTTLGAGGAGARAFLGLVIGTDVQAQDAELAAFAGLVSAADRLPYFTGLGTAALATFTAAGRALIDDASAAEQRETLALGTLATLSTINNDQWSGTDLALANGGTGASDAATARTNLGLVIGTDIQAYDADLTTFGGLAKADGNFIVGDGAAWTVESGDTARTSLGLGTGNQPLFAAIDVGSGDTTVSRLSAGDIRVEGNRIFRVGGTDVPVADGGTGGSTTADARTNLGLGTLATLSSVDLATNVTGALPVGNGGTGQTTVTAARTAIMAATMNEVTLVGPFRSVASITLADDTATSIDMIGASTFAFLIICSIAPAAAAPAGLYHVRPAGPVITNIVGITTNITLTTGPLTGTTSTDTNFNISYDATGAEEKLYFENRSGASRTFGVYVITKLG